MPGAAGARPPAAATRLDVARPRSSAAFPPGPAHRSSHGPSGASARASASATSWLPSSWTPTRPSRTAASSVGFPAQMAPYGEYGVGSAPAATSSARSYRPGLTTSVVRGESLSAASAVSVSSPSSSSNARATHAGWWFRSATASMPVVLPTSSSSHPSMSRCATLRSTAFTTPVTRSPMAAAARSTVAPTAACTGTRIPRIWCAPRRSTSTTAGCRVSSVRPDAATRIWSYVPSRRSVPCASSVAKAASRGTRRRSASRSASTRFAYASAAWTARTVSYATLRAGSGRFLPGLALTRRPRRPRGGCRGPSPRRAWASCRPAAP